MNSMNNSKSDHPEYIEIHWMQQLNLLFTYHQTFLRHVWINGNGDGEKMSATGSSIFIVAMVLALLSNSTATIMLM